MDGSITDKKEAFALLENGVKQLAKHQDKLYAQDTYALLLIFQAMDAAGKDGTIEHVMSGVNPQGCQVFTFKVPSAEERDHDYLWRHDKALPERGRIGIHNRSYYEEVLVVRVHPRSSLRSSCRTTARERTSGSAASRRSTTSNVISSTTGRRPQVLPARLEEGAEAPVPRAHGRPREELEVLVERRQGAQALEGLHGARTRTCFSQTSTEAGALVRHPRRPQVVHPPGGRGDSYQTLEDLNLKYPTLTKEKKAELLEARKVLMAEKD